MSSFKQLKRVFGKSAAYIVARLPNSLKGLTLYSNRKLTDWYCGNGHFKFIRGDVITYSKKNSTTCHYTVESAYTEAGLGESTNDVDFYIIKPVDRQQGTRHVFKSNIENQFKKSPFRKNRFQPKV